jgi:aminoglycoside 6'-N-acetyltransferase
MDVALRPIREEDLDALATRESTGATSPFDDFGARGVGSLRRSFASDGLLPDDGERGRLAVIADGALAGTVSWHPVRYGPNAGSRAFNLGIVLLPDHRGKGTGPRALRAIARYLFEHTTVVRLEGSTDVNNAVMQRAVERAGFTREGVLRRAQFRLGEHHDLVLYSRLRTDAAGDARDEAP